MKSQVFDMHNVFCITTEASKKIVVIDERISSKREVLFQLCLRIAELESKGFLVSHVNELLPDGTRPRIRFRRTKEYSEAKRFLDAELEST